MPPAECPVNNCEARLASLETIVTEMRIEDARRIAVIEHLTAAVETLTKKAEELTLTLERGKGAAWAVRVLWAAVIGAVAWIASHLAERSG